MATLPQLLPQTLPHCICLVTFASLLLIVTMTTMTNQRGHLMPFGKSGKNILVHTVEGFPETRDFLDNFAGQSLPLLMKGAIKGSRSFLEWTDNYLHSVAERKPTYVSYENMKKEIRGDMNSFMSFQKFLNTYNSSNIYIVDDIPKVLTPDVLLPCPLQCPRLQDSLLMHIMWFSSGGTKSVVHVDEYENILCSVRGSKHLTLVDPEYGLDNFPFKDHDDDGSMLVDVDSVDLNQFPIFAEVDFIIADLSPGDCLYIPQEWIHQVNSYGSNIGLNFWWDRRTTEEVLDSGVCHAHQSCDPNFYLSRMRRDYGWMKPQDSEFCYPVDFLNYRWGDDDFTPI